MPFIYIIADNDKAHSTWLFLCIFCFTEKAQIHFGTMYTVNLKEVEGCKGAKDNCTLIWMCNSFEMEFFVVPSQWRLMWSTTGTVVITESNCNAEWEVNVNEIDV